MKRIFLFLLCCLVAVTIIAWSCGVTTPVDSEEEEEEEVSDDQSEPMLYSLTIRIIPVNTGSVFTESGEYEQGTQVTMIATASFGYQFSEWCTDAAGTNPTTTVSMDRDKLIEAVFLPSQDPVISEISVINVTENEATITWTTDMVATGQVEYGKTVAYGLKSPKQSGLVTQHRVTLVNLEPGTTYHFRVKSGANGIEAISNDFMLTTPNMPTEVGGIISSNTRWASDKSPYIITETIQIPSDVALTIEPGVTISKPSSGDMFLLMGTIYAHGTSQEPIVIDGGG